MTRVIISGCNGRMGRNVSRICGENDDMAVVAGVDLYGVALDAYPVFTEFAKVDVPADVVIDFSNAAALEAILDYCVKNRLPVVLCTTGYSDEQLELIKETSKVIPIFRSFNMSIGINLLTDLIKKAVSVLGDGYDIEIVEKHHNKKKDAPSGTALALAESINHAMADAYSFVYDRSDRFEQRRPKEIGISAVRGGSIVGEHEVIFAGTDEVITFTHTAYSRAIFAKGAIAAAAFLSRQKKGLYNMQDVIA